MSVAIYARISRDRDGDGLGILRQLVDCRKETERRGWTVAAEYVDDDISAPSGKQRPAYRRRLEDIRDGTRDAVIVWHLHSCWCCQCRDSAWRLQPGIRRRPPGRTPAFCRRRQRKRLQAEARAAEIPRDRRSRHATQGGFSGLRLRPEQDHPRPGGSGGNRRGHRESAGRGEPSLNRGCRSLCECRAPRTTCRPWTGQDLQSRTA